MAPFNLSDLAVKEIKIAPHELSPSAPKSFVGKILVAHFVDFWAIFWATTAANSVFKLSMGPHLTTKGLGEAWNLVSLSPFTFFAWTTIAVTYFFSSYFLNHGQTAGMKLMNCRIKMKHHDLRESLTSAVKSIGVYGSLGMTAKAFSENVGPHDYLWQALVEQKEISAPDIRTLHPTIQDEELWKIAA